jgi:hypothetical protein
MVLVGIALLIAAGWGSAALLDFDPGLWFWFFACFVVPFLAASNQFGMTPPRAMRP